jgi:hypothetical protein
MAGNSLEDRFKKFDEDDSLENRFKNFENDDLDSRFSQFDKEDPWYKRAAKSLGTGLKETALSHPYVSTLKSALEFTKKRAESKQGKPLIRDEQGNIIGEAGLETPMVDPIDIAMSGAIGGRVAAKAGLKGGKIAKAVISEMADEATFGLKNAPDLAVGAAKGAVKIVKKAPDVLQGIFQGIKKSRIARPVKEALIDDWQIVKDYVKKGFQKAGELDPREARKLMFKKVANQIDDTSDKIKAIDKEIVSTSKELKIKDVEFKKDINDYLVARHAPDYNAEHGVKAAGITNNEAADIIKRIDESPHSDKIKKIADDVRKLNQDNLDLLYSDGASYSLIDKETYNTLKSKYKNHVPLQRILDTDEDIASSLMGKGLDVRGSGLKKGVGSEKKVRDILENVYVNRVSYIQRLEKNIVDNVTYDTVDDFMRKFPEQDVFDIISLKKGEAINDPKILQLQRKGKPAYIKINDPNLAVALKGVNREQVNKFIRYAGVIPRFIARMATTYNPEFVVSNKIRDMQEALVYLAAEKGVTKKAVAKTFFADAKSIKDVRDFIKGKNTEGAKLYKQLRDLGGAGGGSHYGTREHVVKNFNKIIKENRSNPQRLLHKSIKAIDNWNTIFEDSTRLSAFKRAMESGISPEKAAVIAKNASIDFDQMGTAGPLINSLYMFSNASLQGSSKTLRSLIKNPKVLAGTIFAVGTPVFVANQWNDNVDPEWRKKVSSWDRMNGLNVVLPGDEFNYITIPVSWGLKPIKVVMERAYDLANDVDINIQDTAEEIISALVEGYSPISGSTFGQAITPTAARIPVDVGVNRSYTGFKILNDTNQYAPPDVSYFPSLEKTTRGKVLAKGTKALQEKTSIEINPAIVDYVITQGIGGAGRFAERVGSTAIKVSGGEKPEFKEIPFVSRFARHTPSEYYRDETEEKMITKQMGEISRKQFYQNKELKALMQEADPNIIDFIEEQPVQDRTKMVNKIVDAMRKKGIPDKKWYEKLRYLPNEVREAVFNYRLNKVSPEIQEKMWQAAASVPGFLSEGFFMSQGLREK